MNNFVSKKRKFNQNLKKIVSTMRKPNKNVTNNTQRYQKQLLRNTKKRMFVKKKLICLRNMQHCNVNYNLSVNLSSLSKYIRTPKKKFPNFLYSDLLINNIQKKGKKFLAYTLYKKANTFLKNKYRLNINILLRYNMYKLIQYLTLIKIIKKNNRVEWVPIILPEKLRITKVIKNIYNTIVLLKKKTRYFYLAIVIALLQYSIGHYNQKKQNNVILKAAFANKYRFITKYKKRRLYYRTIKKIKSIE